MNPQNKTHNRWDESWLEGENADYLESLYEQFLEAPERLSEKWRHYFSEMEQVDNHTNHALVRKQFCVNGLFQSRDSTGSICSRNIAR